MKFIFKMRALIAGIIFIFLTMFFGSVIILLSFINRSLTLENLLVGTWAKTSLWLFGIEVESQGHENVPKKSALFLFNHTSHFDILILQSVVPRIRFGAKIELFKIPIFGMAMRRAGVLPISRQQKEKVFRVYEKAREKVEEGACYALAPEGTRQESEKLGPFKAGPFIFAINAQMPIVPVVIQGAGKLLPKSDIIPSIYGIKTKVKISFSNVVSVENIPVEERGVLQEQVRNKMQEILLA